MPDRNMSNTQTPMPAQDPDERSGNFQRGRAGLYRGTWRSAKRGAA